MYKALYRKYRPAVFDDMVGQEHVRTVLQRQCETGHLSHAYIFCGTRGTGKTTSAKILAKAVNCLSPINGSPCGKCEACVSIDNGTATDVLELDAASNNKVDDIRTICDELIYPPTYLKKRVYIIDEVHMLTSSAYNALLKTLEEPPEHVIFILATTELNKIPPTILSRCQRFEFRRISANDIAGLLMRVCEKENICLTPDGALLIARLADGAARDGFSLLESCIEAAGGGKIDTSVVSAQLGIAEDNTIGKLFDAVSKRDIQSCLSLLDEYYASAKSLTVLLDDMLCAIRDMLFVKQGGKASSLMSNISYDNIEKLSMLFSGEQLAYFASAAEDARNRLTGYAMNKRLLTELALIRICDARYSDSPEALSARVAELEKKVSAGYVPQAPVQKPCSPVMEKAIETVKATEFTAQVTSEEEECEFASELCEHLSANPGLCRLVNDAKLTVKGDVLTVYVTNAFAKGLISENDNIKAIANAAYAVSTKQYKVFISDAKQPTIKTKSYINEIQEETK